MIGKLARDPKIILKWFLNFFQNFLKLFEVLFDKNKKLKKINIARKSIKCVCQTHY